MKKLVLMLAVIFGVSLVSCGGNKAADNAVAADTVATAVVEEAVVETVDTTDTANVDTTVVVAEAAEVK